MEIIAVIGMIYIGGPIGIVLILVGLGMMLRKKNRGSTLLISGVLICAIAGILFYQIADVNFGL